MKVLPSKFVVCVSAVLVTICVLEMPARGAMLIIPPGYRAHVHPKAGGRIDWAHGEIVAEGLGRAKSTRDQDRQMAARAAEVVAARNAAAMALGLFVDRHAMLTDVRDGTIHVEAMLAGHKVAKLTWDDSASPPTCTAQLRVPMWGVKSVASIVFEEQYARARGSARMPLAPPRIGDPEPDEVLIIDARGLNLLPCLFPIVVNSDGRVLYNFATRSQVHGDILPVVHYVEVDPDVAEALRKDAMRKVEASEQADASRTSSQPAGSTTTRPATPISPARAELPPGKNQVIVRAFKAGGVAQTDIVLRRDDCQRLADSAQVTRLFKHGRVFVVVDPLPPGDKASTPVEP